MPTLRRALFGREGQYRSSLGLLAWLTSLLLRFEQSIPRAFNLGEGSVADMRVAHRAPDGGVAKQNLNETNIGAVLEQVGGEGMAQGVHGDLLFDPHLLDSFGGH